MDKPGLAHLSFFGLLSLILTAVMETGEAQAAPPIPQAGATQRAIGRDPVQQLQEDVERYRQQREVRQLQEQRREIQDRAPPAQPAGDLGNFRFKLNGVDHNPSLILRDDEIALRVKPFIGREVSMADVQAMLAAINALYREKGFVVCEARLMPQRIRNGELFVTLIEGKTGKVTVRGAEHTSDAYIKNAFDLEAGQVSNYRELSHDLVRFNMTNDVVLSVDIRAGEAPETTDYEITAHEPDNWTGTIFADTTGAKSTGRPRAGLSVTNRSVFGRRDAATLLGLTSEGSRSAMFSYSLPVNSLGTRITGSASYGKVEVINRAEAGDVTAESQYYSLRADHPVYADAGMKWTIYGEWNRQISKTDFFDVTINDTSIDTYKSGAEAIFLGARSVFYATAGVQHAIAKEKTFDERWVSNLAAGNAFWRWQATPGAMLSVSGAWQAVIGGDPLTTTQYFYLGHTNGVRGYDNDVLSAEQGAYINLEASYAPAGPQTAIFAFLDAGRLGRTSSYEKRELASVGAGVTWPLWSGASITGTAGFPLIRNIGGGEHVSKARFDLAVSAVW